MHDPDVLFRRIGSIVEIWHREPGGADSGTVCGHHPGWTHFRHWRFTFPLAYEWRRRLFTCCEWCGGRYRKTDRVDMSVGNWIDWTPLHTTRFGTADAMHRDCYSIASAHRTCFCDDPGLSHGDYGRCVFCGGFRAWRQVPTDRQRELAAIPVGKRSAVKTDG